MPSTSAEYGHNPQAEREQVSQGLLSHAESRNSLVSYMEQNGMSKSDAVAFAERMRDNEQALLEELIQ